MLFSQGCSVNTYGPAITAFQDKYDTDVATISKVFTIMTGSYIVGALLAPLVYNYVNRQLAVVAVLFVMSAAVFATPLCPTITFFFLTAGMGGLASGFYDTAQVTWIPEMLEEDCAPFVQGQHFFYALGSNTAALLIAPFLEHGKVGSGHHRGSFNLLIPYLVNGCIVVAAGLLQLLLFTLLRYRPPQHTPVPNPLPPSLEEAEEEERNITASSDSEALVSTTPSISGGKWSTYKMALAGLLCCFCGTYLSMECSNFQFLAKFAQSSALHLSQQEAAYIFTGLATSFAIGRGLGIITVLKVAPRLMLFFNISLAIVGNVLLLVWAQKSLPVLWASSIVLGIGMSTTFASFTAFIERHLIFTNMIGAMMLLSGQAVAACYQLIVGTWIEKNPAVLQYTSCFSIVIMIIALSVLTVITRNNREGC